MDLMVGGWRSQLRPSLHRRSDGWCEDVASFCAAESLAAVTPPLRAVLLPLRRRVWWLVEARPAQAGGAEAAMEDGEGQQG
jgi:hypothetical protein